MHTTWKSFSVDLGSVFIKFQFICLIMVKNKRKQKNPGNHEIKNGDLNQETDELIEKNFDSGQNVELNVDKSIDDAITVDETIEAEVAGHETVDLQQELSDNLLGDEASPESIELSSLNHADQMSLASTDAIHETNQDHLNEITSKNEITEQELNPELNSFMIACQEGNLTKVKELISSGKINANDCFSDEITGLHWACINNRLSIVKYLTTNEYSTANPNALGGDLRATPLHWAARNGLVYIVDYLLSNTDADPSLKDSQNYNTIHLAVHSSNITMIIYLLLTCCDSNYKHKLYIDEPDNSNRTALHWAAYQGDILSINALLKFGADVSKIDDSLFLPIHWAFMKGYKIVLKTLLDAGSDIFVKTDQGKNTFDIAKDMNCYSTWTKILVESGRDPKNNWTMKPKRIQPKFGKLMTFSIPYFLLPAIFLICDFSNGYVIPKVFFSSLVIVGVVFLTLKFVIPIYLVDDRSLPKSPFYAGIFSGTTFWVILVYLYNIIPVLFFKHFLLNILMLFLIVLLTWTFFKTMFINPGYVPIPSDNAIILSQVKELISLGNFDTDHFCVNSFVRKPLRSKYSKASSRLIARFDHYCPWVYNEIGVRNHKLFMVFVYSLNLGMFVFIYLSLKYFDTFEDSIGSDNEFTCHFLNDELCYGFYKNSFHFNLLIWTCLQSIWVTFLTVVQTFQILKGVTTWEFSSIGNRRSNDSRFNHSTVPRDFIETTTTSDISGNDGLPHSRNEFKSFLNLIGIDQLLMTVKMSLGSYLQSTTSSNTNYESMNSINIPTDFGMKQNWLDFWVLGEIKLRNVFYLPIEGENNLKGELVDYYKLYEYPPKNSSQVV